MSQRCESGEEQFFRIKSEFERLKEESRRGDEYFRVPRRYMLLLAGGFLMSIGGVLGPEIPPADTNDDEKVMESKKLTVGYKLAAAVAGFTMMFTPSFLNRKKPPFIYRGTNPQNYPEGYDVARGVRESFDEDDILDPMAEKNDPLKAFKADLADINLDPDKN